MLKAPTMAGCAPTPKGSTWRVTLGSLAAGPQLHPPLDAGRRPVQPPADHRARVVVGLQQPGDELALVGADDRGRLLQVDVGAEPLRQHVAVLVPPAGVVGVQRHPDDRGHLTRIGPVQSEQVDDVAFLEADLAVLQPVDLPLRGTDRLAGLLPRDAGFDAQPPQPGPDQHAANGRAARSLLRHRGRLLSGRRWWAVAGIRHSATGCQGCRPGPRRWRSAPAPGGPPGPPG